MGIPCRRASEFNTTNEHPEIDSLAANSPHFRGENGAAKSPWQRPPGFCGPARDRDERLESSYPKPRAKKVDVGPSLVGFFEALGVGDGTFLPSTNYGTGATHLAVGNFNSDNAPDVVVSVRGGLSLFLNTGGTIEKLTSSVNPSKLQQPVTFTATLRASVKGSPGGTPAGNITFMDGSMTLGTVALTRGKASFVTSPPERGHP